jgi:hypothetical protein
MACRLATAYAKRHSRRMTEYQYGTQTATINAASAQKALDPF